MKNQVKNQSKASGALMASLLALSMGMTASTLETVQASTRLETKSKEAAYIENGDVAALKQKLAESVNGAKQLGHALDAVHLLLIKDPSSLTDEQIEFNPFPNMVSTLRALEAQFKDVHIPHGLDAQAKQFRRAVAAVRSKADGIASIIRQISTTPNTIDSDIDKRGLSELATLSSARLLKLVS
jgi:hypothetical protein